MKANLIYTSGTTGTTRVSLALMRNLIDLVCLKAVAGQDGFKPHMADGVRPKGNKNIDTVVLSTYHETRSKWRVAGIVRGTRNVSLCFMVVRSGAVFGRLLVFANPTSRQS